MTTRAPDFQRARSQEQREVRRQAILRTATGMLTEMPVAQLSLNELSRRVGLAKSNVLRYFESREAVLLEVLDDAWRGWLERLAAELPARVDRSASPAERSASIARTMTDTVARERLFCELISVAAAVLEHNVSPEVARRYKLAAVGNTRALGALVHEHLGELSAAGAVNFASGTLAAVSGIWPLAQPSEAMLCAYQDPELALLRMDFDTAMYEMLATLLAGALVRWP